jgi:hypothetical protein
MPTRSRSDWESSSFFDRDAANAKYRSAEFFAGADAELCVHLAQVPLDCARAQEKLRADLWVCMSLSRESGNLRLLRSELVSRLVCALTHLLSPEASGRTHFFRQSQVIPYFSETLT